jgi:phage FluMu protein Com
MPPFTFACPSCQTVLKSASSAEPGKKIKCPKCAAVFQLPIAPPAGIRVGERVPRDEARVRRYEDEDEDEEVRPRRRRCRRKAASTSSGLWLALGGAGFLLLIGGGITLAWLLGAFTQSRIVGRWTLDHPIAQGAITYEFRSDGSFTVTTSMFVNFEMSGTYSVAGNTLTMVPSNVQGQGMNFPAFQGRLSQMQMQIESVSATELVLSGPGPFGQQQRTVLKRIQ